MRRNGSVRNWLRSELLLNLLIDDHVDAVTALTRVPLPEEKAAAPNPSPAARKPATAGPAGPKMLERGVVDVAFSASPSAARRVLNQLGTSSQQFFVTRALYLKNQQEKGPPREASAAPGATPTPTSSGHRGGRQGSAGPFFYCRYRTSRLLRPRRAHPLHLLAQAPAIARMPGSRSRCARRAPFPEGISHGLG